MREVGKNSQSDPLNLLIEVFESLFLATERTRLIGGGAEPVYLPGDSANQHHRIIFTQDYFSSALHEVAHWCVAGKKRRLQEDYGYWYAPDGRSEAQQRSFEQVEIKPQAMEWIFTKACGRRFRVSADNLNAGLGASDTFKANIHQQVQEYCIVGLPDRAGRLAVALAHAFRQASPLQKNFYQISELDAW